MGSPDDRLVADVFGLTYREHAAAKPLDYRWRLLAPEALAHLRRADREHWSLEKLADYLNADAAEAALRLRRFRMSERVNGEPETPARLNRLFQEWLERFEADARERRALARDLSRLLSSQLHVAAEAGETLADVIEGLEKIEGPVRGAEPGSAGLAGLSSLGGLGNVPSDSADEPPRSWGPQWKD